MRKSADWGALSSVIKGLELGDTRGPGIRKRILTKDDPAFSVAKTTDGREMVKSHGLFQKEVSVNGRVPSIKGAVVISTAPILDDSICIPQGEMRIVTVRTTSKAPPPKPSTEDEILKIA